MKIYVPILLFTFLVFGSFTPLTAQWQRQYPLEKLEQVLQIADHNDLFGFACGTNDLLLRYRPSTQTWVELNNWNKGWRFEAIDYFSPSIGSVVAAGGPGLIVSNNAGATWTEIAGAPPGIHAIKYISDSEIVMSSDTGVFVWKNTNWINLNLPVNNNVGGAFILDRDHIWCYTIGTIPVIFSTADGGNSWSMNTDIVRPTVIRFYDAEYGVALDGRKVYQTMDGGQNWTLVSTNAIANNSYDLAFGSNAAVMMAATFNAKPAMSIDSGKTWTEQNTFHINQRSYSVSSASDSKFWLGNDLSSLLLTTDAGVTWTETCGPKRNVINDMHFINRQNGFACGNKGMLLRTFDGGTHWEETTFGARNHLAIFGLTEDDLWIGTNQRILHSQDSGTTWTDKLILSSSNLNAVLAISATRILAASSTGIIYLSNNAGASWDTVYNAGNQLRSITRINEQRYMVTGFNGVILRSEDQGSTWNTVTIPKPAIQYEETYFLGNEGWLVSSSFEKTMWHTTDAGDTWDPIILPVDRFWDGVYFISPDTGVVVCHNSSEGRAYVTFNGGQNWQSGHITDYPLYGVAGVPNPNGTAWIFGHGSDIEVLPYCNAFPSITDFVGELFPCEEDTLTYSVSAQNIEDYFWSFPSGWTILGDPNQSEVDVVVGANSGFISIVGSNVCGFSGLLSFSAGPFLLPRFTNLSGDLEPCVGDEISYTVQPANVDDLIWSFPPGWNITGASNQATVTVIVGENSGAITVSGSNICGSAQINSLVNPFAVPDVHVLADMNILTLSENAAIYQWFLNGEPIPGATGPSHVATQSGQYHAELIFAAGCLAISDSVDVDIINGLFNPPKVLPLHVFPVPAREFLQVEGLVSGFSYSIIDLTGRPLIRNQTAASSIDVSQLPEGIYFIRILQESKIYLSRFTIIK